MVMNHAEHNLQSAGGLRLYAQRWRPHGEPRTVVAIVHGIGEHSGRFKKIVEHLVPRGHAVYAVDLRGHGRSPGQRGHLMSWSEYREDVKALLGWIAEQEPGCPVFIYGHSMGGLIVLDYILRHPEGLSGAVVSGVALDSAVASPSLIAAAILFPRIWPTFRIKVNLKPEALCRDPEVVADYLADPLTHRECSARWAAEAVAAGQYVRTHASELRVPLLMLHGEADSINYASGTRTFFEAVRLPDKKMHLVPGGYHEPHSDPGYDQVLQLVEEHLLSHVPAGSRLKNVSAGTA
jgi:alpha-beta hydrolase superfamily lysophospholipase